MPRYICILLLFSPSILIAQTDLKFDRTLLESEDKWIVLPMNKDSVYTYGFVYLDNLAGLTFQLGGTFKDQNGKFNPKPQPITSMMKQRLNPTNLKVALVPKARFAELQIEEVPFWLKNYKHGENNVHRLFRLGSTYNAWNIPSKALEYLELTKQIDPKYNNLNFEFAFAYNVLKQFDTAIQIAEEGIKSNAKDCNLYKELLFAQMNLGNANKAEEAYRAAIVHCSNKEINAEMACNITNMYFNQKNKEKFNYWVVEARKWLDSGTRNAKIMEAMEAQMNKL